MHEMSLAVDIVDLALQTAERENGSRVNCVEIEVGVLAGVLVDSLEFCLAAAARSTRAGDAVFQIIRKKAHGTCPGCKLEFEVGSFFQPCPECGEEIVAISGGRELQVTAVTIEEEDTYV